MQLNDKYIDVYIVHHAMYTLYTLHDDCLVLYVIFKQFRRQNLLSHINLTHVT